MAIAAVNSKESIRSHRKASQKQRLQLYFDPEAVSDLDTMQWRAGLASRAEVVRYSLRFFQWLLEETGQGGEVLVRKPDGEMKVLVMPFSIRELTDSTD